MTLPTWIQELIDDGPVLLDGAWGTQLQARGMPPGQPPDLWNLSHPDRVEEVARAYVEAGSRIILTNTFRANRIALADLGEVDLVREINIAGVEISRRACAGAARVFASIGPSGKLLATGAINEEQLHAAFEEQAAALAEGGADALVIETMGDLGEIALAVKAARSTGLPVVACMVFDSGKQKDRTMTGVTPEQAAEALAGYGADIIGANCGIGIEGYIPIAERLAAVTSKPIWVKANAGIPEFVDGEVRYSMTAEVFASYLERLVESGANFVGGCCGTSPEFIRALQASRAGFE
jgi:methionine synthase I (cobalamin-dependent)